MYIINNGLTNVGGRAREVRPQWEWRLDGLTKPVDTKSRPIGIYNTI